MGEEAGVMCSKCSIQMVATGAAGANNKYCTECLRSETIVPLGSRMNIFLRHCPECDSYLKPPTTWINAQSQSQDLLSYCIKCIHLPQDVRILDAKFIQLEPHYKTINLRLSLSLTLEKHNFLIGGLLEQRIIVSFFPRETICESCSGLQPNPDHWVASVQLRQHNNTSPLRRTFFHLEQIILSRDIAVRAIKIKKIVDQGIDFFFGNPSHGKEFVEFLSTVVPVKKQPVSHDTHMNRFVFPVEIPPICRDDLICLPPKVAANYGNTDSPIVICTNITRNIALLNPLTLRNMYLEADEYETGSFKCLRTSRQLVEFVVLDVIIVSSSVYMGGLKCALADVRVARLLDIPNRKEDVFMVRTHLGPSLKPGDKALGYDLNDCDELLGVNSRPKALLVRKSMQNRRRGKHRSWKLKSLKMEVDEDEQEMRNTEEYEEYLMDLEENSAMRFQIFCYHNKEYDCNSEMIEGEDEIPAIPREELLLDLDDITDMENDEG